MHLPANRKYLKILKMILFQYIDVNKNLHLRVSCSLLGVEGEGGRVSGGAGGRWEKGRKWKF